MFHEGGEFSKRLAESYIPGKSTRSNRRNLFLFSREFGRIFFGRYLSAVDFFGIVRREINRDRRREIDFPSLSVVAKGASGQFAKRTAKRGPRTSDV